ncbi:MAG: hypothetical protein AAFV54_05615 [Pseudomonadota bacterium]
MIPRATLFGLIALVVAACAPSDSAPSETVSDEEVAASVRSAPDIFKPQPITTEPWQEVVVSVRDLDRTAQFFLEVAGYEERWRGGVDSAMLTYWGLPEGAEGEALLLGRPGYEQGLVRLVQFRQAGSAEPMRPGSRPWDTGCYFSLMVRAKDLQARYEEALALGWWTETPIADLEFGESKLKIVIFKGPDGIQVQSYERLSPPLPEAIGEFDRMTQPFNVMQMVADRDRTRELFVGVLGFDTFWFGPPYVDAQPTYMPLGIPYNLTTSVRYGAGIYYPQPGEFGRMETIEIMDLEGRDYSDRCSAPNYGILTARFPVSDLAETRNRLVENEWSVERDIARAEIAELGVVKQLGINTPDGAMIDFYESVDQ